MSLEAVELAQVHVAVVVHLETDQRQRSADPGYVIASSQLYSSSQLEPLCLGCNSVEVGVSPRLRLRTELKVSILSQSWFESQSRTEVD